VLAAGAAGAVGIHPQILFVDFHHDIIGQLGKDEHRAEGGVASGIVVEG